MSIGAERAMRSLDGRSPPIMTDLPASLAQPAGAPGDSRLRPKTPLPADSPRGRPRSFLGEVVLHHHLHQHGAAAGLADAEGTTAG